MPPKRTTPEDIIEAFLDQRVVDAISKALAPTINLSFEEILNKKLTPIMNELKMLKLENTTLRATVEKLGAENANLNETVRDVHTKVKSLEAYKKSDNMMISGLSSSSYADSGSPFVSCPEDPRLSINESIAAVENTVIRFCNDRLGVCLTSNDISVAHRVQRGEKDNVRPIVVPIVVASRRIRDAILRAKKVLRTDGGSRVYISEKLTRAASHLFFEARKLVKEKKLYSAWTTNGRILDKKSSNIGEKPILIQFINDFPK